MVRKSAKRYKGVMVLVLSLVILLASASPAAATHDALPPLWKSSSYQVGFCGIKQGNYVRLVQMILNSALLLPKSGIDGVWGPKSHAALRKWQLRHGLKDDGCAGYETFRMMQEGGDRICPPHLGCYPRPHMQDLGKGRWRYSEPQSDPTHYAYFYTDNLCWYIKVGNQYRAVVRNGNVCTIHQLD